MFQEEPHRTDRKKKNENLGKHLRMRSKFALQAYLYEQDNEWADISQATLDLLRAGVELGKKKGREERALRIMISQSLRVFEYDCDPNLKRPEKVRLRSEMRRRAL